MTDTILGRHPVFHLLKSGRRKAFKIHLLEGQKEENNPICSLAQTLRVPVQIERRGYFSRYDSYGHQGVIAEADHFPLSDISELLSEDLILLCDGIQDPQNLGSLCRSAYILGVCGIVIPQDRASPLTPAVFKAASGSLEYLKIVRSTSLANLLNKLKENDFWIYGADQNGTQNVYNEKFPNKIALVIGSEGKGISRLVKERCDLLIKIPMVKHEIGSLNAATSGAVILYEIARSKLNKKL